jgi:hypothetical protein
MIQTEKFIWQDGDITISQCLMCRHWIKDGACAAFPFGVPDAILTNEHDHREPYDGDNGITFEALDGQTDD